MVTFFKYAFTNMIALLCTESAILQYMMVANSAGASTLHTRYQKLLASSTPFIRHCITFGQQTKATKSIILYFCVLAYDATTL